MIVKLLPQIRKVHFFANGRKVGSVFRWKGKQLFRGDIRKVVRGAITKIFYYDGKVVTGKL